MRSRHASELRIVVAGPPKTGNVWLENLLAEVYALDILSPVPTGDAPELIDFAAAGRLPPGSIFHQHYWPSPALFEAFDTLGIRPVTMIRCPYDTFVSLYHYVQRFPDGYIANDEAAAAMIDKPIDHPDVLAFLADGYERNLRNATSWLEHADRTILVRYEDLHHDTLGTLAAVTRAIAKVSRRRLRAAVEASRAEVLRAKPGLDRHIRAGVVGSSANELGPRHLEVMREQHPEAIRSLGYAVR